MPELSRNRQNADYANDLINVLDYGAKGDGVTDDTAAIQEALTYIETLTSGSAVNEAIPTLDLGDGTYNISAQLICPTSKWCLTSEGNAVIKVDNLAIATCPFDNFVRGSMVKNIIIRDTTSARTQYGFGFFSTSKLYLSNIKTAGLEKGFIFDGANDFSALHGLSGFANKNDVVFENTINTSLTFDSHRFDESTEGAVLVNSSLTNVHFLNGGFIMKPTANSITNFNIATQSVVACSIKGNRFEHKGTGLTAKHLYIKGASASFPADVDIESNYFTSSNIDEHIEFDGSIGRCPVDKNCFYSDPNNNDILNSASNYRLDVRDTNWAHPSRTTDYVIFSDSGTASYLEHGVKPILIKIDRIGLPTTATGSQSVTITFSSETRTPNIDMPNSITDYKLFFRGATTGTPILDSEPTIDQLFTGSARIRYNVRTAVAASEIQYDLYIWGY